MTCFSFGLLTVSVLGRVAIPKKNPRDWRKKPTRDFRSNWSWGWIFPTTRYYFFPNFPFVHQMTFPLLHQAFLPPDLDVQNQDLPSKQEIETAFTSIVKSWMKIDPNLSPSIWSKSLKKMNRSKPKWNICRNTPGNPRRTNCLYVIVTDLYLS